LARILLHLVVVEVPDGVTVYTPGLFLLGNNTRFVPARHFSKWKVQLFDDSSKSSGNTMFSTRG